jgi:hypothetical protein
MSEEIEMDKAIEATGNVPPGGPSRGWLYYLRAVGWPAAGSILMIAAALIRYESDLWSMVFQAVGMGAWICGYAAKTDERKRQAEEFERLKQRFVACKDTDEIEQLRRELLDRRR